MLLNIKAKPSTLFVAAEGAEGAEGGEEGGEGDGTDFNWHCKKGLASNIQLVKEEFCKHRGLKPFKTTIIGKPCSGKSFFGGKLAEHYNVPHITVDVVLNDIEHWQDEQEKVFRVKEAKRLKEAAAETERLAAIKKVEDEKKAAKEE